MTYKYNTNPNPLPTGIRFGFDCFGGDEGDRTLDLLNAIQTRSRTKRLAPRKIRFEMRSI